jgi:N-acetylmuramoyl-L-alanine amidase
MPLPIHRAAIVPVLIIFCLLSGLPFLMYAGRADAAPAPSLEKQYASAKETFNQLLKGSAKNHTRADWEKCAQAFKKIHDSAPRSGYAPKCLFMLGRTYQEMSSRFKLKNYLDDAIASYQDCAAHFPNDNLAGDALWAVAHIYRDNLKDTPKAIEVLKKIISGHPNAAMREKAVAELKAMDTSQSAVAAQPTPENQKSKGLNHVLPIKYWSSRDYTRIVIASTGPVAFKEQLLEQEGDQPRRLYIDFANSYVQPKYRSPVPIEDGLLKRIRTGQYNADTVRVVLDIESISSYKVFSLPDPFRVVVDIRGVNSKEEKESAEPSEKIESTPPPPAEQTPLREEAEQTAKAAPEVKPEPPAKPEVVKHEPPAPQPAPQEAQTKSSSEQPAAKKVKPPPVVKSTVPGKSLSLAQQLGLRVKKIVIDPGHGGKDPGAMANGLKEKDIVLKVARKLAPMLENRLGCKVILTRNKDVFIPLEERTAIANKNDADLFISLHVNSSESQAASGIETYYLNLTTNPEAMRVAALENSTSAHQMSDLQNILSDILKNSKISESSRLAQQVHDSVVGGLDKNFPNIKNLGVKQAPFYVLIGAEMPAILVEMSFISNSDDAQHLKDERYLDRLAYEITEGVQSYMSTNSANARSAERK